MKILHISFSNINNLKGGPHVLSFDTAPLDTAGIFAIIGPTGSGKSTILDVITLALFNQIPRFSKSISKSNMVDLGAVITHFAKEADASIVYEINGQRYTSKWSVSTTRTGKLKDYEMTLSDASGNYLDLKRSEVPAKNEEIIGLKYDQFIKSIILAQGEFAKFLKADKNVRGQLLENITGTGIYRKIGKKAGEKYKTIKQSVSLQKELLGDMEILSIEEREVIANQINVAETNKKEVDTFTKELLDIKKVKTDINRLAIQLEEKKKQQSAIIRHLTSFKPQLERLEVHNKLSPIKSEVTLYEKAKRNRIETKNNLDKYKIELDEAEKGITKAIQEMALLTKKKVTANNFKTVMASFERDVNKMDTDLGHIKQKGIDLRERINTRIKELKIELNAKINSETAVAKLDQQKEELIKKLNVAGVSPDSNPADERAALKNEEATITQFKAYETIQKEITNIISKGKTQVAKKKELEEEINKNKPLLEKCKTTIQALEENANNLLKRRVDAIKIASLEKNRSELIGGEPCPLCGAVHHPYAEDHPDQELSEIDSDIEIAHNKLKKEQKELSHLTDTIVKSETSIKHIEDVIIQLKSDKKEKLEKLDVLKRENSLFAKVSDENISLQIQTLNKIITSKETALDALDKLKINDQVKVDYLNLHEVTNDYKTLRAKRQAKFEGDDPAVICNQLQDLFNTSQTSKTKSANSIEIETKDLVRAEELLTETLVKIKPRITALGFGSLTEINAQFLSEDDLTAITQQNEALIKSQTANETQLKSLEIEVKTLKAEDTLPDLTLETLVKNIQEVESKRDLLGKKIGELTSRLNQDEITRKKRAGREQEIEKLNAELAKWSLMNNMIGDMSGNKFANFAQGLTLQNLLVYTNKRLTNLTDRYLLDKPKSDGAMQVIDQYQGNIARSVSTLSGGETFIISLALALSLSDMASRNVSLDSLFIDEGFGTLDQETLDIALDTLEKLQTESQKTVGVISHVEALKERINVKIRLEKNAQGYSSIHVES